MLLDVLALEQQVAARVLRDGRASATGRPPRRSARRAGRPGDVVARPRAAPVTFTQPVAIASSAALRFWLPCTSPSWLPKMPYHGQVVEALRQERLVHALEQAREVAHRAGALGLGLVLLLARRVARPVLAVAGVGLVVLAAAADAVVARAVGHGAAGALDARVGLDLLRRRAAGRRGRQEPGSALAAPSRMSIIQRVSLHWVLSVLSPVVITASMRRLVTGLTALAISRTIASATCGPMPSCGR